MGNTKRTLGFTMIEILVVVAILAILAAVGFYSYDAYIVGARDGQRATDLANIDKSLRMYLGKNYTLPDPTGGKTVTFSGATVWTQGTFGASVTDKTGGPKPLPNDPKYGVEYTYSVLNTKTEFQISGILEDHDRATVMDTPTILTANAASTTPAEAMVIGNYNNLVARVETGSVIYVLAIPSITLSDLSNPSIEVLAASGSNLMVSDGMMNLPVSYDGKGLDLTASSGASTVFRSGISNVILWSGSTLPTTNTGALSLITNMKTAYSGTVSAQSIAVSPILSMTDNVELVKRSNDIVIKYLGGEAMTDILALDRTVFTSGTAAVSPPVPILDLITFETIGTTPNLSPYIWDNQLSGKYARFNSPHGMATDSDLNIYVVDAGNTKVKKYSNTGAWMMTIGGSFSGDTNLSGTAARFTMPRNVGVDDAGYIYVSDLWTSKVKKYSSTGAWVMTLGDTVPAGWITYWDNNLSGTSARLGNIYGMTVDGAGNIYVADQQNSKIKVYSNTGAWKMVIGNGPGCSGMDNNLNGTNACLRSPYDVAVDSSGNILEWDYGNGIIKKYTSTGVWLANKGVSTWVTAGIAVDTNGYWYNYGFVSGFNGGFIKSTQTGVTLTSYGIPGGLDNELSGTSAAYGSLEFVHVDRQNNIYIVNTNGWRVKKYTNNFQHVITLGAHPKDNELSGSAAILQGPNKIAADASGNIYVTDTLNSRGKKYDKNANWLLSFGDGRSTINSGGLNAPKGISLDNSGNIYFAGAGGVVKYNAAGNWLMTIGNGYYGDNNSGGLDAQFSFPVGIDVDTAGNIYVADSSASKIKIYSSTGGWITNIVTNPTGIDIDASGNLFVTQTYKMTKLTSTGALLMTIGSGSVGDNNLSGTSSLFNTCSDVKVDPSSGNIYIVDSSNNKIKKYTSTGVWLKTIGSTAGDNNLDGTGAKLNAPTGVAIGTGGYLYVSDTGNNKIKRYTQ